jgi:hypothetical protein
MRNDTKTGGNGEGMWTYAFKLKQVSPPTSPFYLPEKFWNRQDRRANNGIAGVVNSLQEDEACAEAATGLRNLSEKHMNNMKVKVGCCVLLLLSNRSKYRAVLLMQYTVAPNKGIHERPARVELYYCTATARHMQQKKGHSHLQYHGA